MKKAKKDKNFIKKPIYPGGNKALKEFIKKELKYPAEALKNKIEGVVPVRYTINKKGKVVDTQVLLHLGHGCDEEAERIIRLLKFHVPKNRNIKVHFHKKLNIRFKLPKKQSLKIVYEKPTLLHHHNTLTPTRSIQHDIHLALIPIYSYALKSLIFGLNCYFWHAICSSEIGTKQLFSQTNGISVTLDYKQIKKRQYENLLSFSIYNNCGFFCHGARRP